MTPRKPRKMPKNQRAYPKKGTPIKAELAECQKVRDQWCKEFTEQRDDAIALTKRCAVLETAIRMTIARTDETALANELRFILRGSAKNETGAKP